MSVASRATATVEAAAGVGDEFAKPLAIATALVGLASTAFGGATGVIGGDHLFRNAAFFFCLAVGLTVVGVFVVAVALLNYAGNTRAAKATRVILSLLAIWLFALSFFLGAVAIAFAGSASGGPVIDVALDGDAVNLTGTVTVDNLPSYRRLNVVVEGTPRGRGKDLILMTASVGPKADGTASVSIALAVDATVVAAVEVKAWFEQPLLGQARPDCDATDNPTRSFSACLRIPITTAQPPGLTLKLSDAGTTRQLVGTATVRPGPGQVAYLTVFDGLTVLYQTVVQPTGSQIAVPIEIRIGDAQLSVCALVQITPARASPGERCPPRQARSSTWVRLSVPLSPAVTPSLEPSASPP